METESYQKTFFDESSEEISLFTGVSKKIDVVKMDYIGAESVEWTELFSGFANIKAITYSSGINFIGNLLELFESGEIIFGCEGVMTYNLQEIVAFQNKLIEKNKNIL